MKRLGLSLSLAGLACVLVLCAVPEGFRIETTAAQRDSGFSPDTHAATGDSGPSTIESLVGERAPLSVRGSELESAARFGPRAPSSPALPSAGDLPPIGTAIARSAAGTASGSVELDPRTQHTALRPRIEGRALDTSGEPVSGVEIRCWPTFGVSELADETFFSGEGTTGYTDLRGVFALRGWDGVEQRVVAIHPVSGETLDRWVVGGSTSLDFVFRRSAPLVVTGRCEDPEGRPLEGVTIRLQERQAAVTTTDFNGDYRLETHGVDAAAVTIEAALEGFATRTRELPGELSTPAETRPVNFVLEPETGTATVIGVLETEAGEPVADEVVELIDLDRKLIRRFRTTVWGEFEFTNLEPGPHYLVSCAPEGPYDTVKQAVSLEPAAEELVQLVLVGTGSGTISGTLRDSLGRPLANFPFRVRSSRRWHQSIGAQTDAEGRFHVENIPEGELFLDTAVAPVSSFRGARVEADQEQVLDITLGRGDLSVSGRVRDSQSQPLPGARLQLLWSKPYGDFTSSTQFSTTADLEGEFRVTGLPAGEYRIVIQVRGRAAEQRELVLAEDDEWLFELE